MNEFRCADQKCVRIWFSSVNIVSRSDMMKFFNQVLAANSFVFKLLFGTGGY